MNKPFSLPSSASQLTIQSEILKINPKIKKEYDAYSDTELSEHTQELYLN